MKSIQQTAFSILFIVACFISNPNYAQTNIASTQKNIASAKNNSAPNLIIITTDGFRWQEVFSGMDTSLAYQKKYNHGDSTYLANKYGAATAAERRQKLFPFLWKMHAQKTTVLNGNRWEQNNVNVENPHWFSYPGYSELLTGYADTAINSNHYKPNPHSNVLAFIHQQKAYQGKVIAFGAWDAFDRILNEQKSGFPVINAFESITQVMQDPQSQLLSKLLKDSYKPYKEEECLDVFTHYQAMHYLQNKHPKAMYISYGETDEWAHAGNYSSYLDAAHQVDAWISDIWNWVQSTPGYKDNTYILVTTDHGRGFNSEWTDHGADVKGASSIWYSILGPNNANMEALLKTNNTQSYQKQLAATMTKLIGLNYTAEHPVGAAIY
jgi:hypothetical protein